jgi:signal transduction histidine kinase
LTVLRPITLYDGWMNRYRVYAWTVVLLTAGFLWLATYRDNPVTPSVTTFLFWILLLLALDLLPVSLAFGTEVTMAFPVHMAVAIVFPPWAAMLVIGVSAVDMRELRRQITLDRALFNRAQLMLTVGVASYLVSSVEHDRLFEFPDGILLIAAAGIASIITNLTLVALAVHFEDGVPVLRAIRALIPDPVGGFIASYVLLISLGAATAFVSEESFGKWAVAAFFIPLLFARLSILGARAQQELSEKVQKQQEALLAATEKVFEERERERKRIAEDIHDTSLQMLAAASYGVGNAREFLGTGKDGPALEAISSSKDAIEEAMKALRDSLMDLRRSAVEEGGLMETIQKFADQVATVWGAEVRIEGRIEHEPPIPVALAAVQILQEGLANALKHAGEGDVILKIRQDDGMVHLVVEDEGPGFDPEAEIGADHHGMRLMKERAARVGGTIELDSRPGAGTRLEAILPGGVAQ